MLKPEYTQISKKSIPKDIQQQYNLRDKITQDGCIYVKIKKGMYGLKQAAILEFDNLVTNLKSRGYTPVPDTIEIFHHVTRRTKFCLCVDNFGVKYYTQEDVMHLIDLLNKNYTYTVD